MARGSAQRHPFKTGGKPKKGFTSGDDPKRNNLGRPKVGHCWTDVIREMAGAKVVHVTVQRKTSKGSVVDDISLQSSKPLKYAVVAVMFQRALQGDMAAIRELIERVDGKAIQPIEADITNTADLEDMSTDSLMSMARELLQLSGATRKGINRKVKDT